MTNCSVDFHVGSTESTPKYSKYDAKPVEEKKLLQSDFKDLLKIFHTTQITSYMIKPIFQDRNSGFPRAIHSSQKMKFISAFI